MRIAIIPAAAACTAALIATASPARADDQSFLNYLAAHGQSTTAWPMSPAQTRGYGRSRRPDTSPASEPTGPW